MRALFSPVTLLLIYALVAPAQSAVELKGAGATFPAPIYQKWFANFQLRTPGVALAYEAIGSEAGVRKLLSGEVDFGASDNPKILAEVAPDSRSKFLFFPSVVGAVVPIVNLPGFPSDLSFTPEALAGIYQGKIKKWNDPLLKKLNPRLSLPDLDIVVVHRSDGSGTSYAWTDFLSETDAEWKAQIGAASEPRWPCGRGASGNSGVAGLVKELGGSIGYVEFIYALQNHLSFGRVQNPQGHFVQADLESVERAVNAVTIDGTTDDLRLSLLNSQATGAYPIVSLTWFVVPAHVADDAKRQALKDFFVWMLGAGQRQAAALGYAALPAGIVQVERKMLDQF